MKNKDGEQNSTNYGFPRIITYGMFVGTNIDPCDIQEMSVT